MATIGQKRPASPSGAKPPCPYGLKCYRTKNPKHTAELYHPQIDGPRQVVTTIDPLTENFPTPFHHGGYGDGRQPISLVEQAMCKLSAEIRKKPDWRTKLTNLDIVDKWRTEAAEISPLITTEAIDYVLAELNYLSQEIDQETGIEKSPVDDVYQSDKLLPEQLVSDLNMQIDALFGQLSDDQKDWHPGSNQQVWDIVHPSLYCAIVDRTHVVDEHMTGPNSQGLSLVDQLKQVGNGQAITPAGFVLGPIHPHMLTRSEPPPDFKGRWTCDLCKKPDKGATYRCEKCNFDACLKCCKRGEEALERANERQAKQQQTKQPVQAQPMIDDDEKHSDDEEDEQKNVGDDENPFQGLRFERDQFDSESYAWLPSEFTVSQNGEVSIDSYINNLHPVKHQAMYPVIAKVFERFLPMFEKVLTDLREPRNPRVEVNGMYELDEGEALEKAQEEHEDDSDWDEEEWYENFMDTRPVIQPKAPVFSPPSKPTTVVSLRGRTLQVITKIAQIHLRPECPDYSGGVWHVEGMRNESIVASGIAYFSQHNIGPSELAFRTTVREPEYEQSDHRGPKEVYGLADEEALVQELGAVQTTNGRCIAFPNTFQHKVAPFSLIDKTQPGHRSILVFFLVDPTIKALSTSVVPPQQYEWVKEELDSAIMDAFNGARVIEELVMSYVNWPMTLKEAKQHREGLMKERKFFVQEHSKNVFERAFSLCEH